MCVPSGYSWPCEEAGAHGPHYRLWPENQESRSTSYQEDSRLRPLPWPSSFPGRSESGCKSGLPPGRPASHLLGFLEPPSHMATNQGA